MTPDISERAFEEALESGKTIIVTTLQKFPVIAREIGELSRPPPRRIKEKRIIEKEGGRRFCRESCFR